jgi:hypothetical protein
MNKVWGQYRDNRINRSQRRTTKDNPSIAMKSRLFVAGCCGLLRKSDL